MSSPPIESTPEIGSSSPALQGERVSFTGTLASMTHQQAHELVERHGGTPMPHVSRQTTMLIVGEEGWPLEHDGKPSQKLQWVSQWRDEEGLPIRILNESDWLHLLDLDERREEVHRLYTPAMLNQLLGVSTGSIRRWERLGLIKPVRKVFRLPYFDYQEVTSARRLADLLSSGVSREELEASLTQLQTMWPDAARSLAQLELLAQDSHVLVRDDTGLREPASGQRHFDFEPVAPAAEDDVADSESHPATIPLADVDDRVRWSTDDWIREGCWMLETNEIAGAIEAFRLCLMERPADPELNFLLAEALYRRGNVEAAIERYYAAVEADHNYIEGWMQLGCLHAERKEFTAALDALEIALDLHPDYPDAHWHAGNILSQIGQTDQARAHWESYLRFDNRGPWADQARQRLMES